MGISSSWISWGCACHSPGTPLPLQLLLSWLNVGCFWASGQQDGFRSCWEWVRNRHFILPYFKHGSNQAIPQLRFIAAPESAWSAWLNRFSTLHVPWLSVPWRAALLTLWFFSLAFSAAQFSLFPKDVSILTIPSPSQTSELMVLLVIYLPSFLSPRHCGHSLSGNLSSLARLYLELTVRDRVIRGTPCLWVLHAEPKKGFWFVFRTLQVSS